jgi:hypothetical protein
LHNGSVVSDEVATLAAVVLGWVQKGIKPAPGAFPEAGLIEIEPSSEPNS